MGLVELFFPKNCLGCKKSGGYICENCLTKVPNGKIHSLSKQRFGLESLTSLWTYKGVIRQAIWALKYRHANALATDLSHHATKKISMIYGLSASYTLVPIPLHASKTKSRGFNHAALVGEKIAKHMDWDFIPDLLIKTRATPSQMNLKKKQRLNNLSEAFSLNPVYDLRSIKYDLIIFDDVLTTGATLKEATKTLKNAGARAIYALTLAS